jgi:inhibitor of nuclear factor kappa-B kinase subunit alpha
MDLPTGLGPSPQSQKFQDWSHAQIPDFISSSESAPSSPDLNPLDFSIWGILEARVNAVQHRSVDSLKKHLRAEWRKLSMNTIRTSIASWRRRLRAVVNKRGGRFE